MELITPSSGLLFWMVLIFGIVFFILAKFGFPVITSMVERRNDYISQSLEDAARAREELAGLRQNCDRMLEQTRHQQADLLDQARKSSQQMIEDAKADAGRQAAQILANAKAEIEVSKREAVADVRNRIVDLAVAMSEKILRASLSDDASQKALIQRLMSEVDEEMNKRG